MPTKTDRILGYLPQSFLPDRRKSALAAVAGSVGEELQHGEIVLARILRAHWVDSADEGETLIDDLGRIASMYGLAPLIDFDGSQLESVEQFRAHLKRHVRSLLEGRVTVRGLLEVAAEILGLTIAEGDDVDVWWNRGSGVQQTHEARGEDAARLVIGAAAADVRGADARPAIVQGTVDLSSGADLAGGSLLKLQVDDGGSFLIALAAGQPDIHAVSLDALVAAINAPFSFPEPVASHDGRFVRLQSNKVGQDGRLELEEVEGDAALAIFGVPALSYIGSDPRTATTRSVNLSAGVDLSRDRFLRVVIDGRLRAEIDCHDPASAVTLLDHIRDRINAELNAPVAGHDGATLTIQSPTVGAAGSIFIQEPAAQDASATLIGEQPRFSLGADARQATAVSRRDLSVPIDLSDRSLIRLRLDAGPAVTIDCAGNEPAKTTVEEIINILNTTLGPGRAVTDGRRLTLTSATAGRTGQIVFERAAERDALADIFGFGPRVFHGDNALPATLEGTVDLSGGADFMASDRLGIIVDGGPMVEVRFPTPDPAEMLKRIEPPGSPPPVGEPPEHVRKTSLDEIMAAINAAVGQAVADTKGRQLILTSNTRGAASRIAIVALERDVPRRFVSRAAVQDEAATVLLGATEVHATGLPPTRARVEGQVELQFGVDLRDERWLNVAIDHAAPKLIDCAGPRPRATTIQEVAERINAAFAGAEPVCTHDGKRLTLRSHTPGGSSRIAFADVRARDALKRLLDVPPQEVRGEDAGRVVFTGTVDLARGLDLVADARVKIGVDGAAAVDIPLNHGVAPARKTLGELVAAINGAVGTAVARHDGRFLTLTSQQRGAASSLQFEVPSGTDATRLVFGIAAPRSYQAKEATQATIAGKSLQDHVDLTLERFLRISVNGQPAKLVDCGAKAADEKELANLPLDQVKDAINQAVNGVAHLSDNHLVLRSPTKGSASRIRVEPHVAGDAQARLFGDVPVETRGQDATPAEVVGDVRLLGPVDLRTREKMLIAIDGGPPTEVDVAGPAARQAVLTDIVDAINEALPGIASATIDGQLRLQSPSAGAESRVEVLPRRHLELTEYPPTPASQVTSGLVGHGDTIVVRNQGVADSTVRVEVLSKHGTVAPALVNHAAGQRIDLDVILRPLESAVIEPADSPSRVRVVRRSPYAPPLVLGIHDVTIRKIGAPRAVAPLELPRGVSHWTFLECLGPRFDATAFNEDAYPDGARRTVGMFDIGRLDGQAEVDQSVFAPVPLPPASAGLRFDWQSHRGGALELGLPAELAPVFGGRFNEARFGIGVEIDPATSTPRPRREILPGVVFEPRPDTGRVDTNYIVTRLSGFTLFEASDSSFVVPLGFVGHVVPFRKPRFFTLGSATEPAKLYLVEEASGAVVELKAASPGTWGNAISVGVRPDGPGRYQLEVAFAGDRFESARAAVLGTADDAKGTSVPGILQAKAAGVSAQVTRDRARSGPTHD
jgi:hypothetical protein